jgi:RNAse (barnase) inhibitor barstar
VRRVLRYVPDAARARDQARGRGALAHLLGPVTSRAQALDAIGAVLSFPPWYGRNLDALYDCLTDLSWQPAGEHVLIWARHRDLEAADPEGYQAILAVLATAIATAACSAHPLSVLLADT